MSLTITRYRLGVIFLEDEKNATFYAIENENRKVSKSYVRDISSMYPHEQKDFVAELTVETDLDVLLTLEPDAQAKRQLEAFLCGHDRILPGFDGLKSRVDNFSEWKAIREQRSFDNSTLDNIIAILTVFCNESPFNWQTLLSKDFVNSVANDTERWMNSRKNKRLSIKHLNHSVRLMRDHADYIN